MSYTISVVPEPAFTPNDDVCVVYGAVFGRDGRPVPFVPIEANIVQTPLEDADTSGSAFIKRDAIRTVTKHDGTFEMSLLRGLWCQFTIGEDYFAGYLKIPDCPAIPLSDWMYPYPVRIAWFAGTDADALVEVTATSTYGSYGTVFNLPAAKGVDLFVGLGALRSDNLVFLSESTPTLEQTFLHLSDEAISWEQNQTFQIRRLFATAPGEAVMRYERGPNDPLSEWPAVPAVVRACPPFYAPVDPPEQNPDPLSPLLITFT